MIAARTPGTRFDEQEAPRVMRGIRPIPCGRSCCCAPRAATGSPSVRVFQAAPVRVGRAREPSTASRNRSQAALPDLEDRGLPVPEERFDAPDRRGMRRKGGPGRVM